MAEMALIEIESGEIPRDLLQEPGQGRRVYIETYGCQMNVSDTELMLGVLTEAGFRPVFQPEGADIIVLNTCAIREKAEERVLGRLSQLSHLKRRRPDLVLGVSGCMAKHMAEKLLDKLPYVDLVMGPDSYRRLPELLADTVAGDPSMDVRLDREEYYLNLDPLRREGANAWITIMRGCDKFCTFCIVPYVRGRERSVQASEVLRQVETAASEGFREVTLLGQTVNSYHDGETDFADLLRGVAEVEGIKRIRFTSPHPSDFSEKLIETMAEEKICRFVHLPVQSGSNKVLADMKRSYTVEEYLDLVARVREMMPGVCLSTDVIVGFPGETEADFEATMALVESVRYDSAFMFKYSPREGTVAHREIPDTVSEGEKSRRLDTVIQRQTQISAEINRGYIGRVLEVLVEGDASKGEGQVIGKSNEFKKVIFPRRGVKNHGLVQVKITEANSHTLKGILVEAN